MMTRFAIVLGLIWTLAAGWSAPARAATENPDAVAVIIGNKAYTHPDVPEVSFAHRDADAIKRYVIGTLGFRERNVIDLRDATQTDIEAVFGNERSHKGDLWRYVRKGRSDVVVFYSGHGMPGLNDGRGYLLPSNVAPGRVEINGYPLDVLYANLAKLEARSALVLIDACNSGGSAAGTLVPLSSFAVVPRATAMVPGGLTVLTAAGPHEIASWDKQAEHGLFTAYLLKALAGEADTAGDGELTVAEIKAYLDDEMTYRAKREYGREQTATMHGDGERVLAMISRAEASVATQTAIGIDPPTLTPGDTFKDCDDCPEMMVVPAGSFMMGSTKDERDWAASRGGEPEWYEGETPLHRVRIAEPFAAGKFAVTRAEFARFVRDAGYTIDEGCWVWDSDTKNWQNDAALDWRDPGFPQSDREPAVCVDWSAAKAYVTWLTKKTGKPYRLLSEAEWEYAARAGTKTMRYWGGG